VYSSVDAFNVPRPVARTNVAASMNRAAHSALSLVTTLLGMVMGLGPSNPNRADPPHCVEHRDHDEDYEERVHISLRTKGLKSVFTASVNSPGFLGFVASL
ncbi:hypothetical protein LCGC14_1784450, partial [marine sediment metagenome]